MAQKDTTPPLAYIQEVQELLDTPFGLTLPEAVLDTALRRSFAAGLDAVEAAIRIVHEHAWLVSQAWVEGGLPASDLAELVISTRIDDSARLAKEADRDLLDLLPKLRDFVHQSCFSDEFRGMVANIATWHGIPEHRWDVPDGHVSRLRVASA